MGQSSTKSLPTMKKLDPPLSLKEVESPASTLPPLPISKVETLPEVAPDAIYRTVTFSKVDKDGSWNGRFDPFVDLNNFGKDLKVSLFDIKLPEVEPFKTSNVKDEPNKSYQADRLFLVLDATQIGTYCINSPKEMIYQGTCKRFYEIRVTIIGADGKTLSPNGTLSLKVKFATNNFQ